MPDIAVARAFTLVLGDGTRHAFVPGIYRNQPAEIADHWFTKANLVPDEAPVDMAEPTAVDAAGVAGMQQAVAFAEDQNRRLRAELARVTVAWTEAEMKARRAQEALDEAGVALRNDEYSAQERNDAFARVKAERDAAVARANETEAAATNAAGKVAALTQDFSNVSDTAADEPDEKVGDYVVRKRGKKYQVVKLDVYGKLLDTVGEYDARTEAEAKAEELKAVP
jgi:hypothetical protein